MINITNLAKTIDQYKILNYLEKNALNLVQNLTSIELTKPNVVKIKDEHDDVCFLVLDNNILHVFDEFHCLCWKDHI